MMTEDTTMEELPILSRSLDMIQELNRLKNLMLAQTLHDNISLQESRLNSRKRALQLLENEFSIGAEELEKGNQDDISERLNHILHVKNKFLTQLMRENTRMQPQIMQAALSLLRTRLCLKWVKRVCELVDRVIIMSCSCERCTDKRQLFCDGLKTLSGGLGVSQKTIRKNIENIPEVFISDLRKLLYRLRSSPGVKLTPRQQNLLQTHQRNLRKFTTTDPRLLLAKKRKAKYSRERPITLAQAIGEIFNDNPTFVNHYLSDISDH